VIDTLRLWIDAIWGTRVTKLLALIAFTLLIVDLISGMLGQ
jgi:hypothetical protein